MSVTAFPVPDLEERSAEEVLAYVVERFHPRLYVACSFQKEASVVMDMLLRIEPQARFFTLDTGLFFPETYATWREHERRYGVSLEVHDATPLDGRPWSAEHCCSERKVAAVDRALEGLEAWVTGLRREQAPTRARASKLSWDEAHGLWKFNPLVDWTEEQVWAYISERDLPSNPLHDRGYASIGCAPCTRPGSGREGRWAGQDRTECGLHGED